MDAVDVLMEARAYIEKGWCQRHFAVSSVGVIRAANSEKAAAWCAMGAVAKAAEFDGYGHPPDVVAAGWALLREAASRVSLADWNDTPGRTQEEVLEAYDRAIGLGLERAGER